MLISNFLKLAPIEASYHVARKAGPACLPAGIAPKIAMQN